MPFRGLFLILFGFYFTTSVGQDSIPVVATPSHQVKTLNTPYIAIDSTIRPLEYEKFNEFNANRIHYYNNGNIGAKGHYKSWRFNQRSNLLKGFGDFGYLDVFRNKYQVPLFNVKSPIAELHFLNAYRQGSHFGGYFSQNISPKFNYYLGYTRTHSQGFYIRQETRYDNFDWSSQFQSLDNKYKAMMIFIWQRTKNEENGGLSNPDGFKFDEESRRERLSVHLQNSLGVSQKAELLFRHQYMIASDDSTNLSGLAIYHELSYNDKYHTFESSDTFWDRYYFSDQTFDSTRFKNLYNEGGLKWDINSKYIQSVSAGIFYNIHNYKSAYFSRSGSEIGMTADLDGLSGEKLIWGANASFLIGDKSAAAIAADINYKIGKSQVGAFAMYNSLQPSYFEETYVGNTQAWYNDFEKNKNKTEFGLNYSFKDWLELKGGYTLLSSWIVMNSQSLPQQLKEDISMVNAQAYFRLFPNAPVKLDAHLSYNNMLTGGDFLRMAPLSVESKLFYDFASFKSALTGQMGVSLRYFSKYYANAYNAVTANYYLQNEAQVGNFLYFNAYAIFKIKTLRVYVALENILEGLLPYDYYALPYYPMNDRTFRIGFKWRFFN